MKLLNADLVKGISKKDQHIDTLRKVIQIFFNGYIFLVYFQYTYYII